jgi:hypothetical protein
MLDEHRVHRVHRSKPGQRFGGLKSGFTDYGDQCHFMEIATRVCPEFLGVLRDTVLPVFPTGVGSAVRGGDFRASALAHIGSPFTAWLERFNIRSVVWLHRAALETLQAWRLYPDLKSFTFRGPAEFTREDQFLFVRDRDLETLAGFLKRVESEIRAHYDEAVGGVKSPHNLNEQHAEWLVRFQFMGQSPGKIQSEAAIHIGDDIDSSVIRKGYESAAAQLGIPLRLARRGAKRRARG